jgi:hypothetical protein
MAYIKAVPEEDPQLVFDNMPVKESAFKLTGVTKLYTTRKLEALSHVTGTFEGRVRGYGYDADSGRLVNVVEVLDATIE